MTVPLIDDCTATLYLLQNSASVAVALAQALVLAPAQVSGCSSCLVLAPAQVSRGCSSCLTTRPFNTCAAQVSVHPAQSSRLLTQQDPRFTSYHACITDVRTSASISAHSPVLPLGCWQCHHPCRCCWRSPVRGVFRSDRLRRFLRRLLPGLVPGPGIRLGHGQRRGARLCPGEGARSGLGGGCVLRHSGPARRPVIDPYLPASNQSIPSFWGGVRGRHPGPPRRPATGADPFLLAYPSVHAQPGCI